MYNIWYKVIQRDKQMGKIVGFKRLENEKDIWEIDFQKFVV